jgi:hypothetical protein
VGTNGSHERSAHPRQIPVVRGFRERKTKSPNRLSERFEVGFRRDGAVACRGSGAVVLGEPRGLRAARSCGNSGSLAMFVAMRRASSRVRSLAAARHPGSSSKLEIGERLAVPSLSSEALQIQLGVGVLDDQGGGKRREGWRRAQRGYSQ